MPADPVEPSSRASAALPSAPLSWGRFGRSFVLFALTFALVSAAIGANAPPARFIRDKFEHLEATRDQYEVLFFGASRIFRGVVPELFDQLLAEAGVEVRSYNVAMAAMRPHEADYVLRRVLDLEPARLRWVVVEPAPWTPVIVEPNRFTERAIQWHDLHESRLALRSSWIEPVGLGERIDLLWTHALHLGAHLLQVGRSAEVVRAALGRPAPVPRWIDEGRGFKSYDREEHETGMTAGLRRKFLREQAEYAAAVARLPIENTKPVSLDHYNVAALEQQLARIRASGATPVYVLPPTPTPFPEVGPLAERGLLPNLIAINDPVRHPELFEPRHRFDDQHLNAAGARIFTRELAKRFLEIAAP